MRLLARAALMASLLVAACGSRTGLGLGGAPHDASARATIDATQPADAGRDVAADSTTPDASPGEAAVDAFMCAPHGRRRCLLASCPCTSNAQCCSLSCLDGVCRIDRPFWCGNVGCSDSKSQYCLTTYGGECGNRGTVCTTSADCCTDFCAFTSRGGVCSVPGLDAGVVDAGPSGHYACPTLPSDCRTSPPTCACVVAHQPCGPNFSYFTQCTERGGIVKVTCGTE